MRFYKVIFFSSALILISCNKNEEKNKDNHAGHEMNHEVKKDTANDTIYWCPMDTQIVQTKPGVCPICEMDLEPKLGAHKHDSMSTEDWIYTPANISVLSTIKSVKPAFRSVPVKIKVSGYISYDERKIYNISARVDGRIENLHIKYNYQPIKKGQAIFEIYSHDLQTSQQEYLYLKNNEPDGSGLLLAAKRKLLLLGITENQIKTLKDHDHLHLTTKVYSPYSGFVIEKDENAEKIVKKSMSSMGNNSSISSSEPMGNANKETSLIEGSYVDKGETVFKVANTDVVWGIFEVYSDQLNQIKLNQTIHIMVENTDEMIMGKINFIEPSYKDQSGTIRLRVYLDNKNQILKIGNLLTGEVETGEKKGLWIPQSSVYDLGIDKIVFIRKAGAFETRKISVGYSSRNEVEVISGLSEGEEIAENAQYMIDSESFIKTSK